MKTIAMLVGVVALMSSACVTTPGPNTPLTDVASPLANRFNTLADQVAFDHPCPPERVRVIRSEWHTVDADVCGVVRRYKSIGGVDATWVDVTTLYPASALPPPLPEQQPPEKPPAKS